MFLRLICLGVVLASVNHQVTAQDEPNLRLYGYFWNYVQYLQFKETDTMGISIDLYSSGGTRRTANDQVHGDTPTTGRLHEYSSILSRFQQILNIPSRSLIPVLNLADGEYTPQGLEAQVCPTVNCDTNSAFSRLDGRCNNRDNPYWGSAIVAQTRFTRGVWESVANSNLYHTQDGLFVDTRSLGGVVDDFNAPFLFKVNGTGPFRIGGFDRKGKNKDKIMQDCSDGCTIENGAISKISAKSRDCPAATFQLFSNTFFGGNGDCEYTVTYFPYSFLITLQPSSSIDDSKIDVFDKSGGVESTVSSSEFKFEPNVQSLYWVKLDNKLVELSHGTEFVAKDVFLQAEIDIKLGTASFAVSGEDSTVQFVSRDVFRITTESINSPVSLGNIPFKYAYYNLRFGVDDIDDWNVELVGRDDTINNGIFVRIQQTGDSLSITDNAGGSTEVTVDTSNIAEFETVAGETIKKHVAVWIAWYGNEFYVGYGNVIGLRTVAEHSHPKTDFFFKIGALNIGSTEVRNYVFDIEQQGIPRERSRSTGNKLPSPMDVAQLVHKRRTEVPEWSSKLTMATFQYGQFFDHDIVATPLITSEGHAPPCCVGGQPVADAYEAACFNIDVNTDLLTEDELSPFNPARTTCLDFVRSATILDCSTDRNSVDDRKRHPINAITSFVDASNVYGSDEETLEILRDGDTCFLLTNNNELPEESVPGEACAAEVCNTAGDFRSQEQGMLASMHTLFVREHNRLAKRLISEGGYSNDSECFEAARAIVTAEIQVITEDYFASFLNEDVLKRNKFADGDTRCRYRENTNGGLTAETGITYRMGHTWISDTMGGGVGGHAIVGDNRLEENFFRPIPYVRPDGGIVNTSSFAKQYRHACQGTDAVMDDSVMGSLFANLGAASNLAALNNQRGRDHGVPTMTGIREFFKLDVPESIDALSGIVSDRTMDAVKRLYDSPEDIDLFTAATIEQPMEGSAVGPIINNVMARQMRQLKEGDRFWYTCRFQGKAVKELQKMDIARIVCDNAEVTADYKIQMNLFQQESDDNPAIRCAERDELDLELFYKENNGGQTDNTGVPARKDLEEITDLLSLLLRDLEDDSEK